MMVVPQNYWHDLALLDQAPQKAKTIPPFQERELSLYADPFIFTKSCWHTHLGGLGDLGLFTPGEPALSAARSSLGRKGSQQWQQLKAQRMSLWLKVHIPVLETLVQGHWIPWRAMYQHVTACCNSAQSVPVCVWRSSTHVGYAHTIGDASVVVPRLLKKHALELCSCVF